MVLYYCSNGLKKDIHGHWHQRPVGGSISVDFTFTTLPCAVVITRIGPAKQNIRFTTPSKTKTNTKTPF